MSIKRIAEITGFSYATVARALSGSGYCSAEKRDAIFRAAREIDYKSNLSARTLRNNKTEKILFAIPDICNPFYFRMIEGATKELEKHGYYCMIMNTQHNLTRELKTIDLVSQKYADGLMLVSFNFNDYNIAAIRKMGMPVVLTNRYEQQTETDNFDYVYSDHILGMEIATEHLLRKGCKKIVLLSGSNGEQTTQERNSGFYNVLAKHGIYSDQRYILDGGFVVDKTYEAFKNFCESGIDFDGVITANELMCMGVTRYLSQSEDADALKLRKNIVSFDNTDFAENLGITSVDLQQDKIGESAIRLLMDRIAYGRKVVENVHILPKLVIR